METHFTHKQFSCESPLLKFENVIMLLFLLNLISHKLFYVLQTVAVINIKTKLYEI